MENADKVKESPVEVGSEKPDDGGAEVAGRGRKLLYTCFSCGAGNYVTPDQIIFVCWRCGSGGHEH